MESKEKTILAKWNYPTKTTGDYKYFKDFKVTWYYSYKDGKKDKITRSEEQTINYHTTTTKENSTEWSMPDFNPTKVKSFTVYVTVKPEFDQKEKKVTDTNGKEKTKKENINGNTKKSNTLSINTGAQETVATPPEPTVIIGQKNHVKISIKGYNYASNYARSVGVQIKVNGKIYNKTDDLRIMTGDSSNLGNYNWTSKKPLKNASYYEFRLRGFNQKNLEGNASEWTQWSEKIYTRPNVPKGKIEGRNNAKNPCICIDDYANTNMQLIKKYVIEYSLDAMDLMEDRFGSQTLQTVEVTKDATGGTSNSFKQHEGFIRVRAYINDIQGLTSARDNVVFFRVLAVSEGDTELYSARPHHMSEFYRFNTGSAPLPPTVWSTKGTYTDTEKMTICFNNNSTDGSFLTVAQIKFTYNNTSYTWPYYGSVPETETEEPTYRVDIGTIHDFLTKAFPKDKQESGVYNIQYQVRCQGHYTESTAQHENPGRQTWSDWSPAKSIEVYVTPWLDFENSESDDWLWDPFDFRYDSVLTAYNGSQFPSTITNFPIFIGVVSGPDPQTAIEYQFSITALQDYDILDYDGSTKHIIAGDVIWSVFSAPTKSYLDDNTSNHCLVRINPWDINLANGLDYRLTVTVTMSSGLTATLIKDFDTNYDDTDFQPTATIMLDEDEYSAYITPTLDEVELEPGEVPITLSDVVFHVFRRNYDGTMTEVASAINGDSEVAVVDPHPALNGASYRIVAMSKLTGTVKYIDVPGTEFDKKAIIIQWDGDTQNYDLVQDWSDETEDPDNLMLYGSGIQNNMVVLPYNIDVQNAYDMDKELVKYIGRENPVSYYGTQKGESLNLSTVIPKTSSDIIYALRRLSIYRGDCYVREPNGTGYWANVTVSFNINHLEVTVPVSITATRVEGGL